jgi:hypothetical protein
MRSGRRFNEQEIHALFERAAERQEQARRAEEASEAGLSLKELQHIGQSAGIAPEHVAEAAAELAASEPTAEFAASESMLGIPAQVRHTRRLRGPVGDEAWERVVAELRQTFGQPGVAGKVGRVREWSTTSDDQMPVRVTLTPENEGTRVVIEQRLESQHEGLKTGLATGLVMATFLAGFLLWGDFPSHYPVLIPGLVLAVIGAITGGAWFQLSRHARRQDERFAAVIDRIDLVARDAAKASPVAEPRLDLDTLSDLPDETRSTERRRTRS